MARGSAGRAPRAASLRLAAPLRDSQIMMEMSDQNAQAYARDGVVRVAGAFAAWVEPLAAAIDSVVARWRAGDFVADHPDNLTQNETRIAPQDGAVMITNIVHQHPAFRRFIAESPAAGLIAAAMGSRTARFWIDATFWKDGPGEEAATPWHNDMCTYPWRGHQIGIVWVALSDVGPDDGPLLTLLGSHTGEGRYASPLSPQGVDVPEEYRPWSELIAQTQAPGAPIAEWTAKAGDAILMHPKLIHASKPRGPAASPRRLSLSTRWLGDDMIWRPDAMCPPIPKLMNSPLMQRDAPPPDALFPAQWRAS